MNRLIVRAPKLPGEPPRVDFRTAFCSAFLLGSLASLGALGAACAPPERAASAAARGPSARARAARGPAVPLLWRDSTRSPDPGPEDPELGICGEPDSALARAALYVAQRETLGQAPVDENELSVVVRAAGAPYVWPFMWTLLRTPGDTDTDAADRLLRALPGRTPPGVRRCGVARVSLPDGREAVTVVAADALAELRPLPTRARLGAWLELRATLLAPADAVKAFLLGPSGPPRSVPTKRRGDEVSATFSVDREGPWTIQLVVGAEAGPRPVLEAMTFVDAEPPDEPVLPPAGGESAAGDAASAADELARMANGARLEAGLDALPIRPDLSAAALTHAGAMDRANRLAHDVGDGGPVERLMRAGATPRWVGENVARGRTARAAHRAIWASPSHRANLFDRRFDAMGVAAVEAGDGSVWVCQLFAGFGDTGIEQPTPIP